jgi:hypothetical protein
MDRRTVLGMLGVSGVLLSSLVRKAIGAAPEAAATSANPDQVLAQSAQHGLPTDWQFVAPTRWTTVDESLKTRLNSVLRDASPIDLGGIKVTRSGQIETGRLDPVGLAVELPPEVAAFVSPADEALNLEVINSEYNPFLAEPRDASGKPLVGPFQAAGELYQGKTFLPVKLIMAGMVKAMSAPPSVSQPLIDALSELVVIRTPAHQHRIGAELGNRIVFYGEDTVNGQDINIGHTHIDRIVDALAAKNMRLAKPMSVKSDWPSNYGQLGVANRTYNAHLLAIDYSAGVEDPIPEQDLKAYYHNADMWDCCAAMLVPFADRDPDPQYRDYMYNPLEVYDQQSARDVAAALATLDADKFLSQHGAFYCAEGQYVVANLGPQEDDKGGTLLKQSRFGDTPLGRLIANFIKAPGYAGMSAEERRQHPTIGWDYLLELGENNGGISAEQALILSATDRQGVALDFIDEDIKGWQAYRPKNKEALIARPMTVATLAWGLLRLYMPRDAVAKAIATDIARAYAEGDDSVKESVRTLLSEKDPMSANGQALLAGFSAKAATGLLLGLLSSDQVKASLLYKSGFMDITEDADKQRVLDAYEQFLGILQNADYSTQASLDKALEAADEALADLAVTRTYYNRTTRERQPAKSTVMKYAAPPCFGMWTQQPFLAETGCLRYVATAMHVSEKKMSAS